MRSYAETRRKIYESIMAGNSTPKAIQQDTGLGLATVYRHLRTLKAYNQICVVGYTDAYAVPIYAVTK